MTAHEQPTTSGRPFRERDIVQINRTGRIGRITRIGPRSMRTIELPHEATGRRETRETRSAVRHATEDEIIEWCVHEITA